MKSYYLGIDVGGTKTILLLEDENRNTVRREKIPSIASLPEFSAFIRGFLSRADVTPGQVAAMAMGVPGCVSSRDNILSDAPALGWHNVNFNTELFADFSFPCAAENDVTMALIAECERGVARQIDDVLFIAVGTGLGSAFKTNGVYGLGGNGMAGEIGYFISEDEARELLLHDRESAGEVFGFLENRVSGTALNTFGKPLSLDSAGLFRQYESNEKARKIVDDFLLALTVATANCISLLNPTITVFGGGVSNDIIKFRDVIGDRLARFTPVKTALSFSAFQNDAGAMGACDRARQIANKV